jgi:acylphosphatase
MSVRFRARGRVQGVGYRAFTRRTAQILHLTGWVRNTHGGDVEGEVHGLESSVQNFLDALKRGPPGAWVKELEHSPLETTETLTGFEIRRTT